jgi:hypothetical protein
MLSAFAKLLLVSTSFAPVLLTYAFATYLKNGLNTNVAVLVGITVALVLLCVLIVTAAKRQLEVISFPIVTVKSADTEIVGFMVAYLLPLISAADTKISVPLLSFVLVLFFIVVWTTNSYHVNPLLGMLGYHFYEVATESGLTFLLLTKKNIRNTKSVGSVVQLTTYIMMDSG